MLLYLEANWKSQEKSASYQRMIFLVFAVRSLNRLRCWVYVGNCLVNWLSKCSVFVTLYIIFLQMASKKYNTKPATTYMTSKQCRVKGQHCFDMFPCCVSPGRLVDFSFTVLLPVKTIFINISNVVVCALPNSYAIPTSRHFTNIKTFCIVSRITPVIIALLIYN